VKERLDTILAEDDDVRFRQDLRFGFLGDFVSGGLGSTDGMKKKKKG
jgi:hypothetical protein